MEHAIGTRVRVNLPESRHHGKECTVISSGFVADVRLPSGAIQCRKYVQKVNIPCETNPLQAYSAFRPDWLVPLYDGNEKVSWSECAWQPNDVRVC